ncbi:hypothetical protein [Spiroplasma endosymbiont of Polydrusus pterygomalis]|uniref:hypothetical protein n=1 Tax=Spiroplasma endosymbiont of Polydrusus pterygomalis TaxID=3139327 RepID=UPI003CCB5515
MSKIVFSGTLKYELIDEAAGYITPVSLQQNLNTMIPYINQMLDRLPDTEKVLFLKNNEYPEGTFVLEKNGTITPIVPQYLLSRFQDVIIDAYNLAVEKDWKWTIANKTDATINNLDTGFEKHLVACLNRYAEEGEDLKYPLDFTYKIVATVTNAPQVTASADKKFQFTVKAVK